MNIKRNIMKSNEKKSSVVKKKIQKDKNKQGQEYIRKIRDYEYAC